MLRHFHFHTNKCARAQSDCGGAENIKLTCILYLNESRRKEKHHSISSKKKKGSIKRAEAGTNLTCEPGIVAPWP